MPTVNYDEARTTNPAEPYKALNCFFSDGTRDTANTLLKDKPAGTFLLRPSSLNKPDSLQYVVISSVQIDSETKKLRLYNELFCINKDKHPNLTMAESARSTPDILSHLQTYSIIYSKPILKTPTQEQQIELNAQSPSNSARKQQPKPVKFKFFQGEISHSLSKPSQPRNIKDWRTFPNPETAIDNKDAVKNKIIMSALQKMAEEVASDWKLNEPEKIDIKNLNALIPNKDLLRFSNEITVKILKTDDYDTRFKADCLSEFLKLNHKPIKEVQSPTPKK